MFFFKIQPTADKKMEETMVRNSIFFTLMVLILTLLPLIVFSEDEIYPQFPWCSYGSVSKYISAKEENELKFTGYIEQGIDWQKLGSDGPIFNTFLGYNWAISDERENWWNNNYGPWIGFKLKMPFTITEGVSGGELSVGARSEFYKYFGNFEPYEREVKTGVFMQWYFGGEW